MNNTQNSDIAHNNWIISSLDDDYENEQCSSMDIDSNNCCLAAQDNPSSEQYCSSSESCAFNYDEIEHAFDNIFHGVDAFMMEDQVSIVETYTNNTANNSPTSPQSSSSSSKSESSFDQSTFVQKKKEKKTKQKKSVKVPKLPNVLVGFNRLNGRGTYVEVVDHTSETITLSFLVYTKPTDGKGTKFDSNSLQDPIGKIDVECKGIKPKATNYINMKTADKKTCILYLPYLKKKLEIDSGLEVWIKIQDSNEYFNVYCQRGKGGFSVHNMIHCNSTQFSQTEEVDTLSKFNHGSITPSDVTFTTFKK